MVSHDNGGDDVVEKVEDNRVEGDEASFVPKTARRKRTWMFGSWIVNERYLRMKGGICETEAFTEESEGKN